MKIARSTDGTDGNCKTETESTTEYWTILRFHVILLMTIAKMLTISNDHKIADNIEPVQPI